MNLILLSNWDNSLTRLEDSYPLSLYKVSFSPERYLVYKDVPRNRMYIAYLIQDIVTPSTVPTLFVDNVIIDSRLRIDAVERLAPFFSNLKSIKFF